MRLVGRNVSKLTIIILVILFNVIPHVASFLPLRKYWHWRWQEEDRKLSEITDVTWNHCDVKCTYLETIFPAHDFVVIYFRAKDSGEQFGICYIKIVQNYFIWNQLVQNEFYNRVCGQGDHEEYLKEENKYEMVSIMGIGKGTELPVKYSPF